MSFYELWENLKSERRAKIQYLSGYNDFHMLNEAVEHYFNSLTLYELMEELAEEEKKKCGEEITMRNLMNRLGN